MATAETDEQTREEVERARLARAKVLAETPTDKLVKSDATDAELATEARRVANEHSRPRRNHAIGEDEARNRLARSLTRLPAALDAALAQVRREVVSRPDGPTPDTLAATNAIWDANRRTKGFTDLLAEAIKPDGQHIAEGDPRGDNSRRLRELDERRTAIHNELARRDMVRRGVIGGK